MKNKTILLGHGSGGKLSHDLVKDVFIKELGEVAPDSLNDGATLDLTSGKVVFSTDSFVVSPIEFPGGSIGELAVAGTVNDVAVMGAIPHSLSLGVILEEGLEIATLKRIVRDIAEAAKTAGVKIVCGDTKVVERGKCDKIFINTAGIGVMKYDLLKNNISSGDCILINGNVGDHGMTVLSHRKGFDVRSDLQSDCAPLNKLIEKVCENVTVKWMRDPTRGGVATALNELSEGKSWGVTINEDCLPISPAVEGISEILGLDPLYSANEGKVLMVVPQEECDKALSIMKNDPLGQQCACIGNVSDKYAGKVVLNTSFNTQRIIGVLNSDPLPRIC